MGIRITAGSWSFEATNYSVTEDATPLAGNDTTGSLGQITFTIPAPDPDINYVQDTGMKALNTFGPDILLDREVRLQDSRKGFTVGSVISVGRSDESANITLTCASKLNSLNSYGVQAQPYVGTLQGAFLYYLGLVDIILDILVDPEIRDRPVVFPGWSGELWFHLKEIAVAQDCEISLVSGIILLRPIRTRDARRGRDISRNRDIPVPTLAQAVEVYQYNNTAITEKLVYPPGGWSPEVEVLNVNAGETAEYTLDLSASISYIDPPSHLTYVSESHNLTSVYTIVANDGFPVSENAWLAYGGSVSITINPDTTSLNVVLKGATGLPLTSGNEPASNFSLALGSDFTGNRYSTLRIVGTGVAFNKTKKRVRTGVPASKTGTEIGVTIDNPFLSTHEDLCRAGTRAAKQFAGPIPNITGTVLSINQRGSDGQVSYPVYGRVQQELRSALGTDATYDDVEDFYLAEGLETYDQVQQYWFELVRDDFTNQVFGNINGTRIWDRKSRRWYRIRSATVTPESIQFTAEDDLIHADVQDFHTTRTYGDIQLVMDGLTYRQEDLAGLYSG